MRRLGSPLAVTMGEPAGIGGEITLAAWHELNAGGPPFFVLDDPDRLARLAEAIGRPTPIAIIDRPSDALAAFGSVLPVMPLSAPVPLAIRSLDVAQAPRVLESIETATRLARSGEAAGIVTNPIHKAVLQEAGFAHPGHTEFLAALADVPRTVMMLASAELRVVPVTIHIALSRVPAELTAEAIEETARITHKALVTDFGIAVPRIAIAGLNPHAGEDGRMGREEIDLIIPSVERLRAEGLHIVGPLSADTMFHARARRTYDAALCMYHDQALIPIKTLAFDEGVNVTLGLPFVRTSPDHGTALDIAGKGVARAESLISAISLAAELATRRHERTKA
ncbi:4-hydroxythreonine-4-phosphate dehydrogenase PdxA [Acuticoccus sp. M5D2P5]|uniref:4-hydroxythreonine-4-phosphate dehydrogenase PdxA n=1 Tax=Acuticoccus kalidii TaxID=2910977 RepID=UPI001F21B16F|nr:4-hydroxythreonine-4-phosphate dehydrogenase PdxA [Acuticoccus kalidii]MCF3935925.1 4-hydroxythreonine-4-phosphate dehydrogenase PdxA [Acuticoccus kalidii]